MSKRPTRSEREHWAFEFGTDASFLDWLSHQPSCIDGSFNQWLDGVGRNIPCHVRTVAGGAGTSFKPPFSAVPMTDAQHRLTHQHGNSFFHPEGWWTDRIQEYLAAWVEQLLASRS